MSTQPNESLVAASKWYATLSSEEATPKDFEAWEKWKLDSEDNLYAWKRVEDLGARLNNLPPNIHADSFNQNISLNRRHVLKQMAILLGVGTTTYFIAEQKPWQEILADQVAKTGEMRPIKLADGSEVFMNTSTAININFDSEKRSIELIKGEVLIQTAQEHTSNYRPFSVTTPHGIATALGTKFNVRLFNHHSKVSVYEGAVKISPAKSAQSLMTLKAGQSAVFDLNTYKSVKQETSSAWVKGLLVVYSMPLDNFIAELSRYRNGIIRCDPSVSHLLVSGSFYTSDTDAVLMRLPDILPVSVESRTRYWITITKA